jgi:predicted signal transduction protein with EAL and GGDEF domain
VNTVVRYEKEEIHVNSSIGMSNYPEIATEIVDVLDQSDRAMYFSKENGRGMIVIFGREEEALSQAEGNRPDIRIVKDTSDIKDVQESTQEFPDDTQKKTKLA